MPKLYSARDVILLLKRLGFTLISQKGSQIKMRGLREGKLQTAIIPNHKEVASGTLKSILNQSNVTKKELDDSN